MPLKRTPLYEEHLKLHGRMVDFGGWELPIQYTGVLDEHTACRQAAALFDVSHMGEIWVGGKDAAAYLDYLLTQEVSKASLGQAVYSVMCNPQGGIVDDLVVYRVEEDRFLVVVNASNIQKDFGWMCGMAEKFEVKLKNQSDQTGQIAIQGPLAEKILSKISSAPISSLGFYRFLEGKILNLPALIARTGYTGEDGFELYMESSHTATVWRALLESGLPLGLKPGGLGARDTLRLEMKYALYGHELSENTSPLEAGLQWVVKFSKPDFVGKDALLEIKNQGIRRKLVGIRLLDRGVPRQGYGIFADDTKIGELTSGTQSPTLQIPIGIGYVDAEHAAIGTPVKVEIRSQKLAAEVVKTPFLQKTSIKKGN